MFPIVEEDAMFQQHLHENKGQPETTQQAATTAKEQQLLLKTALEGGLILFGVEAQVKRSKTLYKPH